MREPAALDALLRPRRIALLGVSADPKKPMAQMLGHLRAHGFTGEIYPVNPNHAEVMGLRCYPSVGALPAGVDVALIALDRTLVPGAVRELGARGVKAAVLFTSGFGEVDAEGERRQQEVLGLARAAGLRVLGPNCNGLIHAPAGLVLSLFFFPDLGPVRPGPVAVVSQSGTIPLIVLDRAHEAGFGFSVLAATGNEMDLEITDFVEHLAGDAGTRAIALYLEGLRNPARFRRAVGTARSAGKPVLVLPATRFSGSRQAARYHTGRRPWSALGPALRGLKGLVRVEEVDDLYEIGTVLALAPRPAGPRVGVFNTSGGITVLAADVAAELRLVMPPPSSKTVGFLAEWMKFGHPGNPLDLTGQIATDTTMYRRALEMFVHDPSFDIVVISLFTLWEETFARRVDTILEVAQAAGKPLIALRAGGRNGHQHIPRLLGAGIPVCSQTRTCLRAVRELIAFHAGTRRHERSRP